MRPKFQQRHYEVIASILARLIRGGHMSNADYIVDVFAREFSIDNPNFKRDLFRAAAGIRF